MELSQDFNAKVHSRDGMAHDFFGSVRVGKELCQRFFFLPRFTLRDRCPSANVIKKHLQKGAKVAQVGHCALQICR